MVAIGQLQLVKLFVSRREMVAVPLERRLDVLVVELGKHVHELRARVRLVCIAHLAVHSTEGGHRVRVQLQNCTKRQKAMLCG